MDIQSFSVKKLFANSLTIRSTNEKAVYDVLSACGPMASVRIERDVINRRSLGYGFINFVKHEYGNFKQILLTKQLNPQFESTITQSSMALLST